MRNVTKHPGQHARRMMTAVVLSVVPIALFVYSVGFAYIMPSEQLLAFMLKNFSRINTLVIIQSTRQEISIKGETEEREEKEQRKYKEQLWLKSPGFFRSRPEDRERTGPAVRDLSYRRLLMAANRTEIETYLRDLGIDLEQVAFTRIEGRIAYLIGSQDPDSPKLAIEKERFFPLMVSYRSGEIPNKMVEVRFRDFRQLEKGWYPFEIIYAVGDEIKETYTIQSYEVNVPIASAIFSGERENPASAGPEQADKTKSDEERLKKIIKAFEEKYR